MDHASKALRQLNDAESKEFDIAPVYALTGIGHAILALNDTVARSATPIPINVTLDRDVTEQDAATLRAALNDAVRKAHR